MATLPVELIDLREDQTLDLSLAIAEANRAQMEIEFTVLDSSFADALRLDVFSDTHSGTFFDALMHRKTQ